MHSNRFSHKKKHGWILLVTDMDEKNLIVFQTLVSDQPVVKFWIKHQLQAPGLQRVKVTVMSDSYVGVDQSTVVEYRVKGLEEGKREVKYDPEDLATYDEKNMMEQLMSASHGQEEDEEEEEEEEQKHELKEKSRNKKKKKGAAAGDEGERKDD